MARFPPVLLVFGASCLGLSAPLTAQEKADEIVAPSSSAPVGKTLEWKTPEGRPYWYRIPRKIKASDPPALILFLHGTGGSHGWAFWNYRLADGMYRKDDILVSPDGLSPGRNGTFNFEQNKKDGDQIAGLITRFQEEFPIGRVYVYGHSQGAFFTYWFAGEYPELVDGIIAHAGNVLQVQHPKLAKEKIAVAILHGEADAVVTVECAYRTHEIYKEQGYRKLKLRIVEGLTEQSGHWPLPKEVLEMFDWLDQVSDKTASQAVTMGLGQIAGAEPDLALIQASVVEAKGLLKGIKGEELAELESRIAKLEEFLWRTRDMHIKHLVEAGGEFDMKQGLRPWAPHFAVVNQAFADDPAWKAAMKKPQKEAKKHVKAVDKALEKLGGVVDKKGFSAGVKALEKGFLSPRYRELGEILVRIAEAPPKGTKAKDLELLSTLMADRKIFLEEGTKGCLDTTRGIKFVFAMENKALFPGVIEDKQPDR
ncbi:MAG: CE1 family esterase [Planctomycetota bacterium]|jgi:predicted esterase